MYYLQPIANKNLMTSFSDLAENAHLWRYQNYYFFPCIKCTELTKKCRRAERLNLSFKAITRDEIKQIYTKKKNGGK